MIKLIFGLHRETFLITIEGKKITYKDRRTGEMQLLPLTKEQEVDLEAQGLSPNTLFDEGGYEEYKKATTEKELAEIIIKDVKGKGGRLIEENAS